MDKMISIIVPVYNNDKYITECLNSVLKIKSNNIECIVIDDGSTDKSSNIINYFARKNSIIKVIHTKNNGVSKARNIGLDMAKGEYIMFLDSDDYFNSDFINILDSIVLNEMTVFAHNVTDDNNNIDTKNITISNELPYKIKIQNMIKNNIINTCWGKCFSAKILKDNNIKFNENIKVGEDTDFVIHYLKHCHSIGFVDIPILTYRKTKFNTMSKFGIEILNDILTITTVKKEFVKMQNLDSSLYSYVDYYYYRLIIDHSLNDLKRYSYKNFVQKHKIIFGENKNIPLSINKSKIGITGKIFLYVLKKRMFSLYYILLRIYNNIKG